MRIRFFLVLRNSESSSGMPNSVRKIVDGSGTHNASCSSTWPSSKKLSIKRQISGGARGITTDDLIASIRQEFREHEDLPNTTNPDDWARVSGRKGERIVFLRTLFGSRALAT